MAGYNIHGFKTTEPGVVFNISDFSVTIRDVKYDILDIPDSVKETLNEESTTEISFMIMSKEDYETREEQEERRRQEHLAFLERLRVRRVALHEKQQRERQEKIVNFATNVVKGREEAQAKKKKKEEEMKTAAEERKKRKQGQEESCSKKPRPG